MIQITPQMRFLLLSEPVDFRRGIDGLSQTCRSIIKENPFSGTVFIFINKRKTSIKLLVYDGQGYWLMQKRLSKGKFNWWPKAQKTRHLAVHELQLLIWNGNPTNCEVSPNWRDLNK